MPLAVFTQTNFAALSLSEVDFLYGNDKIVAFEAPFGGLRGNVGCSSKAHWKALTELLLVIIELFSLAPTVQPLRANIE